MLCSFRVVGLAAYVVSGSLVLAAPADQLTALDYLEGLDARLERYIPPSRIDPRYTMALYVNAATSGPNKQRMWVLQRDGIGGPWRLAMWDRRYWKKKKLTDSAEPPFSWPVSTGRQYRGDRRSGPTPLGVFSLDERKGRSRRGWHSAGMIHTLYIDYHYSSGRRSAVAFHGTTPSKYRKLGWADSHGCIRMHQRNALVLHDRVSGRDGVVEEAARWGEVPRFWKGQSGARRWGYLRDGRLHAAGIRTAMDVGEAPPAENQSLTDTSVLPNVLTKKGFRVLSVIFYD